MPALWWRSNSIGRSSKLWRTSISNPCTGKFRISAVALISNLEEDCGAYLRGALIRRGRLFYFFIVAWHDHVSDTLSVHNKKRCCWNPNRRSGAERTTSTNICYNFLFMFNSAKSFIVSDLRHSVRLTKKLFNREISTEIIESQILAANVLEVNCFLFSQVRPQ